MTESEVSAKSVLEIHEEILQRVENVDAKIRTLSLVTMVVAALLVAGYLVQLALPYASGVSTVTVDLTNPSLMAVEVGTMLLALVWLYVGVSNYRFVAGMAKAIRIARAREAQLEKSVTGEAANA